MEDASGEDLDWFWRGWFYNTEPCDIAIDTVKWANLNPEGGNPKTTGSITKQTPGKPLLNSFDDISKVRNREDKRIVFATDADTSLRDFYWRYDRDLTKIDPLPVDVTIPAAASDTFTNEEKVALAGNKNLYEITFSNKGGLVMPIILEWTFKDGTKEVERIPVQIWRKNENKVVKVFVKEKEAVSIKLDPMRETADINEQNNNWPAVETASKFQLYKAKAMSRGGASGSINPMQREIK